EEEEERGRKKDQKKKEEEECRKSALLEQIPRLDSKEAGDASSDDDYTGDGQYMSTTCNAGRWLSGSVGSAFIT
ncbi:hypothetical protein LINPERPRIM_LOCUS2474, partial [Linum perenne]